MLKLAVLVSGGGTNLQAIIDAIENGAITNAKIELVISNNKNAFALERAARSGIPARCISPRDYNSREQFEEELLETLLERQVDLVVLAGCLVVIPEKMVDAFKNRIINIHPSLIPSFCGTGYYGLKVHEEALRRGVKITGATVHFVDKGTDTGPIILQKAVEVQPEDMRQKLKGDYLVKCGMYSNAMHEYEQILNRRGPGNLGAQFYAEIWNNLGCAYARMFLFEDAADCFLKGYRQAGTKELLRRYVSVLPLYLSDEEYRKKIKEVGADSQLVARIQEYNSKICRNLSQAEENPEISREEAREMIGRIREDYCRSAKC